MPSTEATEDSEVRRPLSSSEEQETRRLLSESGQATLYRTISGISEHEPLLGDDADVEIVKSNDDSGHAQNPVWGKLSVLLIGVFVSQTDGSLMLATYGKIASEFNDLENAVWLMSALILASCVAQPLYGKLSDSDICGRKACLQASYILFVIGTAGVGLGQTLGQVIAARAVQGAGAAGMTSMVSIIITDLVPIREVATLRAYVNVLATTGRSCGGVVGGVLTQTLGWRWAFLIQVPPIILAILLVQWKLDLPLKEDVKLSKLEKLKRIDFIGAFFLCGTILCFCLILDLGRQQIPWDSTLIKASGGVGIVSAIAFVITAQLVPEPIFPLRLLAHYSVVTNCANLMLQVMIQMSLMMTVPIFYQAVEKASTGLAGAYLIPAFAGNTLGGLLAGLWIKKTGLYKVPIILAPVLAAFCMVLCYTTWSEYSSGWSSLAIFPGGFATGMISSASFVALAAGIEEKEMPIAASGMYLVFNIGSIGAISSADAVFGTSLKQFLQRALQDREDGSEIIQRATSNISYVQDASKHLRRILVPAYVHAFHQVNLFGLSLAAVSFVVAVFSKGGRLTK